MTIAAKMISVSAAARLLGLSSQTAYELARNGILPLAPGIHPRRVPIEALRNVCDVSPAKVAWAEALTSKRKSKRATFASYVTGLTRNQRHV